MRLVHVSGGDSRILASDVERAEGFFARARGLMFRRSVPDDYALVFPFDGPATRSLHMMFVPFPIDAVWIVEDEVTRTRQLSAWTGLGWGRADTICELPAGAADGVETGDTLRVEG